jgi:hypothetical protein
MNLRQTRCVFGLSVAVGLNAWGWAVAADTVGPDASASPATAPTFAGAPAGNPTGMAADTPAQPIDPVQALLNNHQYSAAVRLAAKILGSTGGSAGAGAGRFDRFRVLILKGEGLLGMHENYMAIEQFNAAAHASQDPRDVALARSAVELVHRATGNSYVPRFAPAGSPPGTPKPPPIPLAEVNLLDAEQRRPAFNALLDDQLSALMPRIRTATAASSLPSIYPVLQQVEQLARLDTVANGDAQKTASIAGDLLDHVRNILASSLHDMAARLSDIEQYASTVTNYGNAYPPTMIGGTSAGINYSTAGIVKRNGLSQSNRTELTNMIANCAKIHQAADAFGAVASAANAANDTPPADPAAPVAAAGPAPAPGGAAPVPGAPMPVSPAAADWPSLGSDADRLAAHAKDLLDTNFDVGSSTYSTQVSDPYGATNGYGGYPAAPVYPTNPTYPGAGVVPPVNPTMPRSSSTPTSQPSRGTFRNGH